MREERFTKTAWNTDVNYRTDTDGKMELKMERRLYKDERYL